VIGGRAGPAPGGPGRGFYTVRERDILLRVKAKPGARTDRVAGQRGDSLLVEVRAAPERGRANEAIALVLADALDLRASMVALKSGAASPNKVFVLPLESRAALQRLGKELT
jgi:uncharacterized protein YggU (UPF0235/DUF167 family)